MEQNDLAVESERWKVVFQQFKLEVDSQLITAPHVPANNFSMPIEMRRHYTTLIRSDEFVIR